MPLKVNGFMKRVKENMLLNNDFVQRFRNKDPILTELNLQNCTLTDKGAKYIADALKDNHIITKINFSDNEITDVGAIAIAEALENNYGLIEINLMNTQITDIGVKLIASALKVNKSLKKIDLSQNNITDIGATNIAEALRINKNLTMVDLDPNNISSDLLKQIIESTECNKQLLKILPSTKREEILQNVMSKILPPFPSVINTLITKYDGISMLERIYDKINPNLDQTLDDIMKSNNLEFQRHLQSSEEQLEHVIKDSVDQVLSIPSASAENPKAFSLNISNTSKEIKERL